jgi:hypothetical protein
MNKAICMLLLAGCAKVTGEIRAVAYPPSFHYIPLAEVRSTMWELAADVVDLEQLLHAPVVAEPAVVERLSQMERHAASLATSAPTNHPKIDANLGKFQSDLQNAKLAAQATPPNYFFAGMVTGSCKACHDTGERK